MIERTKKSNIQNDNITYLWGEKGQQEVYKYSDDPLEDLLNEFGTEDPKVIEEERIIYECTQNLKTRSVLPNAQKNNISTKDKNEKSLNETIEEAQNILNQFNYYNSYLKS